MSSDPARMAKEKQPGWDAQAEHPVFHIKDSTVYSVQIFCVESARGIGGNTKDL